MFLQKVLRWVTGKIKTRPSKEDYSWVERDLVDGFYGDMFERAGGNRKNLKAFSKWLVTHVGSDVH